MRRIVQSTLFALATLGAASMHYAMADVTPATVTTTGDSVTTTVLADSSTVVKFLANGTFMVSDGVTARLLLVGGGGGGGAECGGGGGGGGFVEASDVELAPGTYTVTVGARGEGGNTQNDEGEDQNENTHIPLSASLFKQIAFIVGADGKSHIFKELIHGIFIAKQMGVM